MQCPCKWCCCCPQIDPHVAVAVVATLMAAPLILVDALIHHLVVHSFCCGHSVAELSNCCSQTVAVKTITQLNCPVTKPGEQTKHVLPCSFVDRMYSNSTVKRQPNPWHPLLKTLHLITSWGGEPRSLHWIRTVTSCFSKPLTKSDINTKTI